MSTTNILDLNNRIDELAESYPADKVMMSDGASVEADLASAVPRTASGTTVTQLVSAINQLTEEQKDKCCIKITSSIGSHLVRRITGDFYTGVIVSANGAAEYVYEFIVNNTPPIYGYVKIDETSFNNLTITAWTLYYQGTPIS